MPKRKREKNDELKVRLPGQLKADAMKAAGHYGLSREVRDLLLAWLSKKKDRPG